MTSDTSAPTKTVVRVGVGVLVQDPKDPSRVFCGIRKGSHGAGTLALPGGHLELYETWEECATREVLEECNLILSTPIFGHVTNDPMPDEGKHYVTIFMMATCVNQAQEPQTMEPDKCEGWKSYSWKELQEFQTQLKLFGPLDRLVQESPPNVLQFLKSQA
jgi:8-oxo-dGTP diphosphatase